MDQPSGPMRVAHAASHAGSWQKCKIMTLVVDSQMEQSLRIDCPCGKDAGYVVLAGS